MISSLVDLTSGGGSKRPEMFTSRARFCGPGTLGIPARALHAVSQINLDQLPRLTRCQMRRERRQAFGSDHLRLYGSTKVGTVPANPHTPLKLADFVAV
jgi:hypothetical protein